MNKKKIQALTEMKDGTLTAIASTETEDRVGDSLKVGDWDFTNFVKNPVLQAGHDYHPASTIGVAKNLRIEGKKVLFDPVFHDITQLAREIGKMYQEGILKAWSVGYIPANGTKTKHELLEVSAVAVPANAEALMATTKSLAKDELDNVEKQIKEFVGTVAEEGAEPVEDDVVTVEEVVEVPVEKIEEVVEEKSAEEKSDVNETVEEQLSEDEARRAKYKNLDSVDTIVYAFYHVYMQKETAVGDFNKLLNETIGLLSKLTGAKKDFVGTIYKEADFDGSLVDFMVELKEGRVLSKKNIKVISDTLVSLKNSTEALEKLVTLTSEKDEEKAEDAKIVVQLSEDTPVKAIDNSVQKGRKQGKAHEPFTAEQLVVHILKEINKKSSYGLNQIKK